jgi:hypothetical protein
MKMIAHQAIGVNLPVRLATGLRQRGQKQLAICRVTIDFLPAIPRFITW